MSLTQISLTIIQLLIMAIGVYFSATKRLNLNHKKRKVNSYLNKLIGLVNEIDKIDEGFSKKVGISDIKKQYFKEITGIYTTLDNQKKIIRLKEKVLNDKYSWWDIKTVLNKYLFEDNGNFHVKISTSQRISYWLVWFFAFLALVLYFFIALSSSKSLTTYQGIFLFIAYFFGLLYYTFLLAPKIMGVHLARRMKKDLN